jgi:signal transduction histidine kinase
MKAQTDLAFHGLVHDLNNVFATILDAAEILESDPRWASLASIIERNALLGRRILGSFVDSGGAPVSVDAVMNSARLLAGDFLQSQDCTVMFQSECEPGLEIRGSSSAWERAFVNLLINAGQAMGDGGTVTISARQANGCVEITIADSGPGIPADCLEHIFEPGFSTKPARSGLGLHIAESIVKQNGGSISAANRVGAPGAVFRILAPGECLAQG